MADVRIFLAAVLVIVGCSAPADTKHTGGERYNLGHAPDAAALASIDIDVNPKGVGLPAGRGTASVGAALYAQKCAMCHGPRGEGIDKVPKLIGKEPGAGFSFAGDVKAVKTIGNYWPYATTLFDYIRRTMPLSAPGTLTSDDTYSLVAFLLSENGIITPEMTIDAKSLPGVRMPAQSHFVKDDRTGGPGFR